MSEFWEWQAYFQERLNTPDKPDYYAAATIRAIFASQGAKTGNIADYMLQFELPKANVDVEQAYDSKSMWLGIFNIDAEQA